MFTNPTYLHHFGFLIQAPSPSTVRQASCSPRWTRDEINRGCSP